MPTPEEKYEYCKSISHLFFSVLCHVGCLRPSFQALQNEIFSVVKAFLDPKRWRQEVHFKFGALSPANYDGNLTSAEFDRYLNVVMGISETESDECMLDIVKSRNQSPDCVVSDMCNSVMVEDRRNQSSYGITHRLLYVQVARMLGCSRPEVWFEDCAKRFCSHILWESRTIANLGFNPSWDDLLLEQIVLCGLEGFQEFLNEDWAEHILHIQRPAGCFGPSPPSTGRRSKREMNYLTNDCTDHTTGLGVAGLTLFLEYFFKDY